MVISEALVQTNHIVSLDLSSNCISATGAQALFSSLIINESLIDLNLASITKEKKSRNRIRAKGLDLLKQVLIKNQSLQILNLSGNSIRNEGIQILHDGLM
jgi:Ran GTPase-activating protein (RanGAP) involved in mRNA processing and transport